MFIRSFCSLFLAAVATSVMAQAGPPLITDDPGTVPKNHVELNLSVTGTRTRSIRDIDAPLVDFNYGWTPRTQIRVEVPWIFHHESGPEINGLGNASLGLKWRFQDETEKRIAISMYPGLEFNEDPSASRRGIAEAGTSLVLPLQFEKEVGGVTCGADCGVVLNPESGPGYFTGIAVGRNLTPKFTGLAELHFEGVSSEKSDQLIGQIGGRYRFEKESAFIFALGTGLFSKNTEKEQVTFFFGVTLSR